MKSLAGTGRSKSSPDPAMPSGEPNPQLANHLLTCYLQASPVLVVLKMSPQPSVLVRYLAIIVF